MSHARKALAAFLIFIGALAAWSAAPNAPSRYVDGVPASLVATAALAWSQTHCGATLQLKDGAPRLMMDDLLRFSAAFDAERAANGLDATCRKALATAAEASEHAANTPAPGAVRDAVALRN